MGEETSNAFGAGTAMHWYHLACGARQRPEAFVAAWQDFEPTSADESARAEGARLMQTAELGKLYYRLQRFVRVERASSGRARLAGQPRRSFYLFVECGTLLPAGNSSSLYAAPTHLKKMNMIH